MASERGRRWEIERAIDRSNLHPYERLLLRVLLSRADAHTAIIPDKFSPSIGTLRTCTGISQRSIVHHLGVLDRRGWLKRDQARGRRTKYRITIPAHDNPASARHALVVPRE